MKQPNVVLLHKLTLLDNVVPLRSLRRCVAEQGGALQGVAWPFEREGGSRAVAEGVRIDLYAEALTGQCRDDRAENLMADRMAAVADP